MILRNAFQSVQELSISVATFSWTEIYFSLGGNARLFISAWVDGDLIESLIFRGQSHANGCERSAMSWVQNSGKKFRNVFLSTLSPSLPEDLYVFIKISMQSFYV